MEEPEFDARKYMMKNFLFAPSDLKELERTDPQAFRNYLIAFHRYYANKMNGYVTQAYHLNEIERLTGERYVVERITKLKPKRRMKDE